MSQQLSNCLLCGVARAARSGLCADCRDQLPTLDRGCRVCALPLPPAAAICPQCIQYPPAFASAQAAWHYAYPVAQLLQRFKYQGDLAAGRTLSFVAAGCLEPRGELRPQLLLPIPVHWRRLWQRGFNQAQLIAAEFSRHWRIPVAPRLLGKLTPGTAQQQLSRAQRLRNLRRSFRVRHPVAGLHLGLVDDVITTGATLNAAADVLRRAGAARVSAYALARTP
ncbi:ComF family protein [Microbulbifer sp. TYP-18]|uniref:ComF family protein n=1 Tax=Microbulbifer sp. TYP-18 TaxID=3230024 RepID=UPI0034C6DA5B